MSEPNLPPELEHVLKQQRDLSMGLVETIILSGVTPAIAASTIAMLFPYLVGWLGGNPEACMAALEPIMAKERAKGATGRMLYDAIGHKTFLEGLGSIDEKDTRDRGFLSLTLWIIGELEKGKKG